MDSSNTNPAPLFFLSTVGILSQLPSPRRAARIYMCAYIYVCLYVYIDIDIYLKKKHAFVYVHIYKVSSNTDLPPPVIHFFSAVGILSQLPSPRRAARIYICVYIYVCLYVYIDIDMYIYMYIHIYT